MHHMYSIDRLFIICLLLFWLNHSISLSMHGHINWLKIFTWVFVGTHLYLFIQHWSAMFLVIIYNFKHVSIDSRSTKIIRLFNTMNVINFSGIQCGFRILFLNMLNVDWKQIKPYMVIPSAQAWLYEHFAVTHFVFHPFFNSMMKPHW